jgi:hypothetical protein
MFVMKVPPEVEELLQQLRQDYPRAEQNIRMLWGPEKASLDFFRDLLTYQAGTSRQGFSHDAFKMLTKIRDIYVESYIEFKCINASKGEREMFRKNLMDVWDRALF